MTDNVIAKYPEYQDLQRLADLRERGGWRFHIQHNVEGEQATFIIGVCTWPDGSADVFVVRNFTAAHGRRTNPAGGVVWRHDEAALGDVVDALLALPAPDDPGAPTRVIGVRPGLWTSG
jgi:hypothetical protein